MKEQAERRIAKLNGALQAAESRCRQLAADHAAAAAALHAQPPQARRCRTFPHLVPFAVLLRWLTQASG